MKNIIYYSTIAFILFTGTTYGQANAQVITNRSSIELNYAQAPWANSSNAAGLIITPLRDYNIVSVQYDYQTGNYKLQQEGDSNRNTGFNTNGALRIGKVALWGNFTFLDNYVTGSAYNTNLYEPSPEMPYYIADPNKSDWRKQYYDMAVKAAMPAGERIGLGIEVCYSAKKGAKQLDPRSTIHSYGLDFKPSLIFKLSDKHYAGASFRYKNIFDRISFENSLSYHSEPIYIMKGLGNFSNGIVSGTGGIGVFYYTGNTWGSGLQYGFSGDRLEILLDLTYSYRKIEVFESPSKPRRRGDTDNSTTGGTLQLIHKGETTHKAVLSLSHSATDGIEYIQEYQSNYDVNQWITIASYIKSMYKTTTVSLKYDLFAGSDRDYSWKIGVNGIYTDIKDEYILPRSLFGARNGYAEIYAGKNFTTSSSSKLFLGLNCGYKTNWNGEYIYNGSESASLPVTDLYTKNLTYLSTDYLQAGCDLDFSFALESKSSVNVNLNCQWINAQSYLHQNRTFIKTSIAYIF